MKIEVFIREIDFTRTVEVYILQTVDEKRYICTDIKTMAFTPYKDEDIVEPTFKISGIIYKPFLQGFANALNKIGIRPEGKPILENELTATKYHLEDMRMIVNKFLNKKDD